jgi:two-component system chemotaxis response regulator CheB
MGDSPERVVVVGTSAGGVDALRGFVGGLSPDLQAAILVVMHIPASGGSVLPRILGRSGPLPATHATDREPLLAGHIYVAPADHHLLVHQNEVRLSTGPRQNGHRPAADPLFRSAALSCGPRAIALVLSGTLDDGAAGALAVAQRGGVVAVQDPREATYEGMPRNTMALSGTRHVLPVRALASLVERLIAEPVEEPELPVPDVDLVLDTEMLLGAENLGGDTELGSPSGYVCPDCGGSLYAVSGSDPEQFRCRVGHGWSPQGLLQQQTEALETALWTALRTLRERAELSRRMAGPAARRGHQFSAARFTQSADEADRAAGAIHDLLEQHVRERRHTREEQASSPRA